MKSIYIAFEFSVVISCFIMFSFLSFSFCTGSSNGVDAVILNEKSPVIMTKPPDDIDVSQKPVLKKSPNVSGTHKRKYSTQSKDIKANDVKEEENDVADVIKHDAETDSKKPVLNKTLHKAGDDTVHVIKETPIGVENQNEVEPNRYHSSRKAKESDNPDVSVKETETNGNHSRDDVDEDGNTYCNTIGKRVQVSEFANYVNSKSYESTMNEFEVSVFLNEYAAIV